jgi:hypothetical protein
VLEPVHVGGVTVKLATLHKRGGPGSQGTSASATRSSCCARAT